MPATTASATSRRSFRIGRSIVTRAPRRDCDGLAPVWKRPGDEPFRKQPVAPIIQLMATFAVVASRSTPTNTRLGSVLTPAQALTHLRPGDVALGRLDVLESLGGIERGLWALDVL